MMERMDTVLMFVFSCIEVACWHILVRNPQPLPTHHVLFFFS